MTQLQRVVDVARARDLAAACATVARASAVLHVVARATSRAARADCKRVESLELVDEVDDVGTKCARSRRHVSAAA